MCTAEEDCRQRALNAPAEGTQILEDSGEVLSWSGGAAARAIPGQSSTAGSSGAAQSTVDAAGGSGAAQGESILHTFPICTFRSTSPHLIINRESAESHQFA